MSNKSSVHTLFEAVGAANQDKAREVLHPEYKQHNLQIPDGRDGILSLFPILGESNTKPTIIRLLEDGEFVVAHNHWTDAEPLGGNEVVTFDIFRTKDGLLAEHWDAVMPKGEANPSGRSLIDGETEIKDLDKTDTNKSTVKEMFTHLIEGTTGDLQNFFAKYFEPNYHQHNPILPDGVEGILKGFQDGQLELKYIKQHLLMGEGNFVLSVCEADHAGKPAAVYDLVRFEGGKIVEHWDVIQDVPEQAVHNNTMFGF